MHASKTGPALPLDDPQAHATQTATTLLTVDAIRFDQGFGDERPYADASFDRVFSSFMFHHLPTDEKCKTLRAIRRVLKPGGGFHMLDFEGPGSGSHGVLTYFTQTSA